MDRLLNPRSVAVVGAIGARRSTYASETLLNLRAARLRGRGLGRQPAPLVGPRRARAFRRWPTSRGSPDAVVVAIPAAGRAGGDRGGGSRWAAAARWSTAPGFGETARRRRRSRRRCARPRRALVAARLRAELRRADLAALARGAVGRRAGGAGARARRAGLPERQPGGQRARRRGAGCGCTPRSRRGNEAVVTHAGLGRGASRASAGVRSIALLVEADGDGARLCEALAVCADAGVGVAVLKVGASAAGAAAAAAHTGAVAGRPPRLPRARGGGGRGVGGRRPRPARAGQGAGGPARRGRAAAGLAILTCSGGDSGLGADEAARVGARRCRRSRSATPSTSCATAPGRRRTPVNRLRHGDYLVRSRRCATLSATVGGTRRSAHLPRLRIACWEF